MRKLLAVLLAAMMLCGMLAVGASAEDDLNHVSRVIEIYEGAHITMHVGENVALKRADGQPLWTLRSYRGSGDPQSLISERLSLNAPTGLALTIFEPDPYTVDSDPSYLLQEYYTSYAPYYVQSVWWAEGSTYHSTPRDSIASIYSTVFTVGPTANTGEFSFELGKITTEFPGQTETETKLFRITVTVVPASGTNPGTDPGTDPGTNPGTDPGIDPGGDPIYNLFSFLPAGIAGVLAAIVRYVFFGWLWGRWL